LAFARLILEFGRLEYLIKLCIKDMHGRGFTEGMIEAESQRQFKSLCEYAKRLAHEKLTSAEAVAFVEILEAAIELAEYRNDTVHAYWTIEDDAPLRVRQRLNRKTAAVDWSRARTVSVGELTSSADQIRNLWVRLNLARKEWSVRAGRR
jgi:hypothetical protein